MKIIADIHIHSPYSRATSPRLSPASLERWARIKGIGLLGSGDCTHPKWLEILRDNFEDSGGGFYRLKDGARSVFDAGPALSDGLPKPPDVLSPPVFFVLSGEIATIYKKNGKVRKIHHIVLLPDFASAAAFNAKLERVGNIRSDGRPILGLDSAELLSMLLETDERAVLIPAHIWTPWFSALGAKSGFDSLEECYGPLSVHIPAVETGLSSNPPMNWALSALDKYSIISNSDAHSPDKLGREASILEMDFSFDSFVRALKEKDSSGPASPEKILGTIEFFPEEGKYHYDGHRKCEVCLAPEEAAGSEWRCPVCGKPLTRGVLGRVLELADRPVDEKAVCPIEGGGNRKPYHSLIPLKEILAELLETGAASKKVDAVYGALVEKAGNEFSVLLDMPLEKIEKFRLPGLSGELLAEAVGRMRRGEVSISPGYDGEYGVIRTFAPGEQKEKGGGLFEDAEFSESASLPGGAVFSRGENPENFSSFNGNKNTPPLNAAPEKPVSRKESRKEDAGFSPDKDQLAALSSCSKTALIVAGPGTGKTKVLSEKIAKLIREGASPSSVLALSFTTKAAAELRGRILNITKSGGGMEEAVPQTSTFHSFCAALLREQYAAAGLSENFSITGESERNLLLEKICAGFSPRDSKKKRAINPARLGGYIEERKRFLLLPGETPEDAERFLPRGLDSLFPQKLKNNDSDPVFETLYGEYRNILRSLNFVDYEGLIAGTVRLLAVKKDILAYYREKFRNIFVDEYQDINFSQYALIRFLADGKEGSPSLWVIGDPNQAIYGFRGSDKAFIDRFELDYPGASRFELCKSFRCAEPIIKAAGRLTGTKLEGDDEDSFDINKPVSLFQKKYSTEKSEAEGIARAIESLAGGTSFFAIDSGSVTADACGVSPGDFAVLLRAAAMAEPVAKAFGDHGIPFEISGASPWWEEKLPARLLEYLREHRAPCVLSPGEEIRSAWEIIKKEDGILSSLQTPDEIKELVNLAALFGSTRALLDALSIGGIPEIKRETVKIMTIHAAKGLEFDHVFVPGLEEGILPFSLYGKDENTEEEKRLLYVAMTRARRRLWLSYSASRNFRGRILKAPASRFLAELGELVPLASEDRVYKRDPQIKLF